MKKILFALPLLASTASAEIWHDSDAMPHDVKTPETKSCPAKTGEIDDSLEPLNRVIFEFNDIIDGLFLEPMAKIYKGVFPDFIRQRVTYFLQNLRSPVDLGNNILQGNMDEAGHTVGRFIMNTTLGVAGLFEVAEEYGLPYERKDFGQTLGLWGVGEGFYLVLPLLGPSNARDVIGRGGDWSMQPLNWWAYYTEGNDVYPIVATGLDGLEARTENLEVITDLRQNSLDYYAAVRSWYTERRRALIRGEDTTNQEDTPSLDDDE